MGFFGLVWVWRMDGKRRLSGLFPWILVLLDACRLEIGEGMGWQEGWPRPFPCDGLLMEVGLVDGGSSSSPGSSG
ncbi:hypothetical protein B0T18DRAFT_409014 [Schizothecium vesticola]|uniref:Secreted protein n=1 Tax=Schizothecium vesticola TaxID=314040 RepID=A0AA40F3E1_9PEZI|nr:hypothetical protein B0T18DRAFT_409014 [Schizothecium vesticola]